MNCPLCSANIPAGSKFCEECGGPLPRSCSACGHANSLKAKFCSQCGASLSTTSEPVEAAARPKPAPVTVAAAAERRQLTVMFCDMVGSSALSTRLDAEEQREVIAAFHTCCANEVKALGGMVAQYLGDGVLAYFGYPIAHENDAERAILAGLAILKVVETVRTAADGAVQTRIAIGSGVVVVGDLVREGVTQENAAIGETTNLVARLQAIAEPNSLVISPVTHRLVGALFDYRDLGRQTLKGFPQPVHVRQVLGPSKVESRFEAQHQAGTSPLLGREEELELLLRRWEQSKCGEGRVVLVTGEPGIGKSRLARALRDRLTSDQHTSLRYFCSPHHEGSALYPFISQLTLAAGIDQDDAVEIKLDKLHSLLTESCSNLSQALPLFAALLSIPGEGRYPLPEMTPQRRKEQTLALFLDRAKHLSERRPVLMVFEDLHWIDPTSLELLSLTIEQVRRQRILLLATARPEFTPAWPAHHHVSTFSLNRLSRLESEAVIWGITKGKLLPSEVLDQIIGRTDGVPLFIEELTKTVLEGGLLREGEDSFELVSPLPPLGIPSTLHASLLARLDRLGSVKDVVQIGATIGREFSYALIAAIADLPEEVLQAALMQLVDAELIFQRGVPPDAMYQFKHALVRDTAFASLLRSRRQQLHGRTARALAERFGENLASVPEIVAHHFTEAGLVQPALEYWLKAGKLALNRSAHAEAVKHLRRGLDLIQSQDASPQISQIELEFYLTLAPAMMATKGYNSPETHRIFLRAHDLIGDSATLSEQTTVLWGEFQARTGRAEYAASREVARRCLSVATRHAHSGMLAMGNRFMGQTLFHMGAFIDARFHLQRALDLCALENELTSIYRNYGVGDWIAASKYISLTLWVLGYLDQAASVSAQTLARARSIELPFTVAVALDGEVILGALGGDPDRGLACAIEAIAHSVTHKHSDFEQRARFIRGALLARGGDPHQAIEIMGSAAAAAERNGDLSRRTMYLCHLATFHAESGKPEAGLALLREAIQTAENTDERFFEPELYRLRGELFLMLNKSAEAEAEFQHALVVARQQQARWWELRAALSATRLWREQGRDAEACAVLNPIFSWFTEGFDTPELKEAKELLAELSA